MATHPAHVEKVDARSLDWDLVMRLAKRHRVKGHLAEYVLKGASDNLTGVPPCVLTKLKTEKDALAFSEMRMLSAFKMIKDQLDNDRIGFVLIKGLQITSRAYGRLGIRSNHDIDILVDESDVVAAKKSLTRLGFNGNSDSGDIRASGVMSKRKDLELYSDRLQVAVDLHWRFFVNRFLLPVMSADLTRTEHILGNCAVQVLQPHANIVYLSVHGAHHGWSRLKWLADMNALLAVEGRDTLVDASELANQLGVSACLDQALFLQDAIYKGKKYAKADFPGLRDWLLHQLALTSIAGFEDREIEMVWGGTKFKNLSHYLLKTEGRYLRQEFKFDLKSRISEINPFRNNTYSDPAKIE
ncbi:nucleotidyltransferase family protein [Croceicoccus hydrothermalis]|uniref:nucleotidyltransferase family protein n=1 Tax=Croceicoccus hydrothermalis TaxID=2867964 RepID=UPI001EFB41F0|nr:nucleotidyltransferase family protein [Croceicoccus hydrothermalis]